MRRMPWIVAAGALAAGALYRFGWKRRGEIVRAQKTLIVGAPIDEVYGFWARIENFPRFMEHVLEVRRTGPGRSHWRVAGPAGVPIEWDAEVTEHMPDRCIAWRSVPGSKVMHRGEVKFEWIDENTTRIDVFMMYKPPGGALGHGIASFLHGDPRSMMNSDLYRLKTMLEAHV
jgi:uncharacterized membrane protein